MVFKHTALVYLIDLKKKKKKTNKQTNKQTYFHYKNYS